MSKKPKITVKDEKIEGTRFAYLIEFDTGEKFWYVTSNPEGIEDRLKAKYEKTQAIKQKLAQKKIEILKGKEIDW